MSRSVIDPLSVENDSADACVAAGGGAANDVAASEDTSDIICDNVAPNSGAVDDGVPGPAAASSGPGATDDAAYRLEHSIAVGLEIAAGARLLLDDESERFANEPRISAFKALAAQLETVLADASDALDDLMVAIER